MAVESVLFCWSMSSGGSEVSRSGVVGVWEGVSCLWCTAWWGGEWGGSSGNSGALSSGSASGGRGFSGMAVGCWDLSS